MELKNATDEAKEIERDETDKIKITPLADSPKVVALEPIGEFAPLKKRTAFPGEDGVLKAPEE